MVNLQMDGEERNLMRFADLQVGDFFRAHGLTFLKLPRVVTVELPDANAIDALTGQLACFGLTVPVAFAADNDLQHTEAHHTAFDQGSESITKIFS